MLKRIIEAWKSWTTPSREHVRIDDEGVVRTMRNGVEESVRWDDLVEVGIMTTDEGPWVDDVYWLLVGTNCETGCAVPSGAEGSDRLLERLQQLPGFDNLAVIQAMGSTDNASFTCWKKPA